MGRETRDDGNETWEVSRCGSRRGAAGDEARASRTRIRDDRRDRTRYAPTTRLGARYDSASARKSLSDVPSRCVGRDDGAETSARAPWSRLAADVATRALDGRCADPTRRSVCAVALRVRRRDDFAPCAPPSLRARSSAASHPQTARAGVASDRSPAGRGVFAGIKIVKRIFRAGRPARSSARGDILLKPRRARARRGRGSRQTSRRSSRRSSRALDGRCVSTPSHSLGGGSHHARLSSFVSSRSHFAICAKVATCENPSGHEICTA